jgi:CheY-like chemotaxis protein
VAKIVVTSNDGSVEETIEIDRRYFSPTEDGAGLAGYLTPELRESLLAGVGDAARRAVQADVDSSARARGAIRLPSGAPAVRVFLCEDDEDQRKVIRVSLESDHEIRIVGEAGDGRTAVELISRTQPDVVVLDLGLPGLDGIDAIPLIRDCSPASQIVVFSGFQASQWSSLAMRLGVARYIEKGAGMEVVRKVVKEVASAATAAGAR